MKKYHYFLLKMDGTKEDLGISPEKDFQEMYKILDCSTIQIVPPIYYSGRGKVFVDEEGRFHAKNKRNPHFKVLTDKFGAEWDVVGNAIVEEPLKIKSK